MTKQELINDLYDGSKYVYPETFRFLKSLPNTEKTDTGIIFYYSDVVQYCSEHALNLPIKMSLTGQ